MAWSHARRARTLPLYRHCPCRLSSPGSAGWARSGQTRPMAVDPSISAPVVAVLEEARQLGFLGPGPVARHLEHAAGFAQAFGRVPGPVRVRTSTWDREEACPAWCWATCGLTVGSPWSTPVSGGVTSCAAQSSGVISPIDSPCSMAERRPSAMRQPCEERSTAWWPARSGTRCHRRVCSPIPAPGGRLVVSEPPDTRVLHAGPQTGSASWDWVQPW